MRKTLTWILLLMVTLVVIPAQAALDDSEAWSIAQEIVKGYLGDEEDCSNFSFPWIDYRISRKKDVYSIYADVKYEDEEGDDQRDYFGLIFKAEGEEYSDFTLMLGLRVITYCAAEDELTVVYPYADNQ